MSTPSNKFIYCVQNWFKQSVCDPNAAINNSIYLASTVPSQAIVLATSDTMYMLRTPLPRIPDYDQDRTSSITEAKSRGFSTMGKCPAPLI